MAGVDRIFAIGGAQAIAAMAYGTETVPHVDKIYGPGNIFVVLAKRRVFGVVEIDQLPGPTETLLVADESADPELVAADLLAQAEHDPMASAILITSSRDARPCGAGRAAARSSPRWNAPTSRGSPSPPTDLIVLVPDVETAIDLANCYAPEHLCLLLHDPWSCVPLVRHAGGIFVGEDSPEALGDYTAGPSHVMPTGGTARFSSPIHVAEFTKVISVIAANNTRDAPPRSGDLDARARRRASPLMPAPSSVAWNAWTTSKRARHSEPTGEESRLTGTSAACSRDPSLRSG